MANELALTGDKMISIISQHGITDLIKPLVKEIELFDTYVAGTTYAKPEHFDGLKEGDKLILRREQDNRFDDKAILILNEREEKIGYVPEKDNMVFSRLMDAGKLLTAKVKSFRRTRDFSTVHITIYLVDF